jgi:hypothetical protein
LQAEILRNHHLTVGPLRDTISGRLVPLREKRRAA